MKVNLGGEKYVVKWLYISKPYRREVSIPFIRTMNGRDSLCEMKSYTEDTLDICIAYMYKAGSKPKIVDYARQTTEDSLAVNWFDGELYGLGVARRSWNDINNKVIARKVAYGRLIKNLLNTEDVGDHPHTWHIYHTMWDAFNSQITYR